MIDSNLKLFLFIFWVLFFSPQVFGRRELKIPVNRGISFANDTGESAYVQCFFNNISTEDQTLSIWARHGGSEPNGANLSGAGQFTTSEYGIFVNELVPSGSTFKVAFKWPGGTPPASPVTGGSNTVVFLLPTVIRVQVTQDTGAVLGSCFDYFYSSAGSPPVNLYSQILVNSGRPF